MAKLSSTAERYKEVRKRVADACKRADRKASEITIIGVTKTKSLPEIKEGVDAGIHDLGENYVQELMEKEEELADLKETIRWHYIGHLQRNKAKYLVPFVSMIHSIDSERLAREVNKQGEKIGRKIPVLLQVNTSGESSKFGCYPGGAMTIAERMAEMEYLDMQGLMTLATFSDNSDIVRPMFRLLRDTRDLIADKTGLELAHLSMGMTNDFEIAIEEGATIIRIGTAIFGPRPKPVGRKG